ATPVVIEGTDELDGSVVPFQFTLANVRQVVYLHFLPGYYDSLGRFGLGAAADAIQQGILSRVQGIYAPWNLEFRLEEPSDYAASGYSIVEIGGPDPNGAGLFG